MLDPVHHQDNGDQGGDESQAGGEQNVEGKG